MVLRAAWTRARAAGPAWGRRFATAVVQARVPATVAGWGRTLVAATGVAGFAGSGQIGVAYGLGLLRPGAPDRDPAWSTHLTWIVWFALLAVLAGAAGGAWAARRQDRPLGFGGRIAVCLAAAVGGAVVLPLAAWPARVVTLAGRAPVFEVGVSAALGVTIGLLAALVAFGVREVAASLTAVAAASWALALVSVAPSLDLAAPAPPVRLGVLDLPNLPTGVRLALGILCPLLVALAPGAVLIIRARRRATVDSGGTDRSDAAGSGAPAATGAGRLPPRTVAAVPAAGALLALSYLIGGPGPGLAEAAQVAPYAASLAALGAGALAVLLMVLVRGPLLGRLSSLRVPRPSVRLPRLPLPRLPRLPRSPRLPGVRRTPDSASTTPNSTAAEPAIDDTPGGSATADPPTRTGTQPAGAPGDTDRSIGAGKPKSDPGPLSPGEEEYLGWVAALGAQDDAPDPGAGRRRLRREPPTTPPPA